MMKKLTCLLMVVLVQFRIVDAAGQNNTALMDFSKPDKSTEWRVVNDGVMGGLSEGAIKQYEGHMRFYGLLSLDNNGGFSSIRAYRKMDLSGKQGIRLRVRGDGRTYKVRFETDARFRGRWAVSYSGEFKTRAGEWIDVQIPFDILKQSFRGRRLSGYDFNPAKVERFGLTLADKREGPFSLDVRRIESY